MVISNTAAAGNIFDKEDTDYNTDIGIIIILNFISYFCRVYTILDGIYMLMMRL